VQAVHTRCNQVRGHRTRAATLKKPSGAGCRRTIRRARGASGPTRPCPVELERWLERPSRARALPTRRRLPAGRGRGARGAGRHPEAESLGRRLVASERPVNIATPLKGRATNRRPRPGNGGVTPLRADRSEVDGHPGGGRPLSQRQLAEWEREQIRQGLPLDQNQPPGYAAAVAKLEPVLAHVARETERTVASLAAVARDAARDRRAGEVPSPAAERRRTPQRQSGGRRRRPCRRPGGKRAPPSDGGESDPHIAGGEAAGVKSVSSAEWACGRSSWAAGGMGGAR
jgi:hypothetical protein